MGSNHSKEASATEKTSGKSGTQEQEKHNSADSKTPLTCRVNRSFSPNIYSTIEDRSYPHDRSRYEEPIPSSIEIDDHEGHSNVTRPPPPPQLRRLSELIDPNELTIDSHVRSPSGNLLAVEQFIVHPDRPMSIRERQEQICQRVRAASRLDQEFDGAQSEMPNIVRCGVISTNKPRRRWSWVWCGCLGRS